MLARLILVFLALSVIPTLLTGFLLVGTYQSILNRLMSLTGLAGNPEFAKNFSELNTLLDNAYIQAVIIISLAVIFCVFFIVSFSRKLNYRIKKLIQGTYVVSRGNLERKIEIDVQDELGSLAHSFNMMVTELKKSRNRLEEEISKVQDLFIQTIKSLSAAVDAKDPYTHGHSDRVARLAGIIASEYKKINPEAAKNPDFENTIYLAALLHDIGKIGIMDGILLKNGGLTEQEYNAMCRHPEIGVNIVKGIGELKQVIPGILHHHERFNGEGYPAGLKGRDISIEGRIIALADAYDAMTSERPYSKKFQAQEALEEIKRLSGIQFDPDIVTLFCKSYSGE